MTLAVRWWFLQDRFNRRVEQSKIWFVWHLPSWVIYWAIIRASSYQEKGSPLEATVDTMLKRFNA